MAAWNTSGRCEHGQRGEVAAEAPPADGDPIEVELGMLLGGELQRVDLIVEHGRRQIAVDGALPLGASARCAPTVDDHDRKALIGEPLRAEIGVVRMDDALRVRTAVRVEQHRQRRAEVAVGQQHRCGQLPRRPSSCIVTFGRTSGRSANEAMGTRPDVPVVEPGSSNDVERIDARRCRSTQCARRRSAVS